MNSLILNQILTKQINLSFDKMSVLNSVIENICSSPFFLGILFGGSVSYKEDTSKSDVDLFCLVNKLESNLTNILESIKLIEGVDVVINQGSFPWTGRLYTIYFKQNIDFSIDLCLIDDSERNSFFWEPNGIIIYDIDDVINKTRDNQMAKSDYTNLPFLKSNPFALSIITLKKIEKNISRNHLWNAIEQVNIFRRYLMQIIRLGVLKDFNFLGRVDRDIESVLPEEINKKLAVTSPIYCSKDIAKKTISLINLYQEYDYILERSDESNIQNWIKSQLRNEKIKLKNYA